MDEIESFLDAVSPSVVALMSDQPGRQTFVAVRDQTGVVVEAATPSVLPPDAVLRSLIEGGATAAAYINFFPDRAELLAQVYVGERVVRNSDLRRAAVSVRTRAPSIGPWQYVIDG